MNEENSFWEGVGIVLVGIGIFFLGGVVVRDLWFWFMVPLGLPAITMMHAIGLDIFMTYISPTNPFVTVKDQSLSEKMGTLIATPLVPWAFGWVIHYLMLL